MWRNAKINGNINQNRQADHQRQGCFTKERQRSEDQGGGTSLHVYGSDQNQAEDWRQCCSYLRVTVWSSFMWTAAQQSICGTLNSLVVHSALCGTVPFDYLVMQAYRWSLPRSVVHTSTKVWWYTPHLKCGTSVVQYTPQASLLPSPPPPPCLSPD